MSEPQTLYRIERSAFAPTTLDEETRTFEVVAATGAETRSQFGFMERIDLAGAELPDGIPVMNGHQQTSLDRQLGVVDSWQREPDKIVAKVRLSERADWFLRDLKAGIARAFSIGATPLSITHSRTAAGEPLRIVSKWRPFELAAVPLGADTAAVIREAPSTLKSLPPGGDIRFSDPAGYSREIPPIRTAASVGWSSSDPAVYRQAMGDALYHNVSGTDFPDSPARTYSHVRGYHDLARECLEANGIRTAGMSAAALILRSQTTSDFPQSLGTAVGRFVLAPYSLPAEGVMVCARDRAVPDFKQQTFLRLSSPTTLLEKPETAEAKYGYVVENYEVGSLKRWSEGFSISYEARVNDDKGVLAQLPTQLGVAARRHEIQSIVALLDSNSRTGPLMSDGTALFTTGHGTTTGTLAAPDEAHLTAGMLAIDSQTDASGNKIGIRPTLFLVPSALRVAVNKLVGVIYPASTANVNAITGFRVEQERFFTSATRYFVVSLDIESLVMLRLEGASGPQLTQQVDFATDEIRFRITNNFAPAFIDYRAWYADGSVA
jgi:hypothetical protein